MSYERQEVRQREAGSPLRECQHGGSRCLPQEGERYEVMSRERENHRTWHERERACKAGQKSSRETGFQVACSQGNPPCCFGAHPSCPSVIDEAAAE